jgi:lipid biosynthesis B12-binding/radical SAM protein
MRVLLISSNTATSPYPLYPLGLSMIASALKGAGHDVMQFDYLRSDTSLGALDEAVRAFSPELVGISMRNIDNVNFLAEMRYVDDVKDIVKRLRGLSDAMIVLGGAGYSLIPDALLRETGADYGIAGEGEALMVDFVARAEKGVYPEEKILGPEQRLVGEEIPSALYDSGLLEFYTGKGNIASVQTKRGCAFHCVYCTYPLLEGHGIRPRNPERVVDDIVHLRDEHKVKYIFFIDSVFNDGEGRYLDVLREMKRRGVFMPWTAFFRPEGLTPDIVALMKETGLVAAEIGTDAATDVTLRRMGKNFTMQDVRKTNQLLVEHGVSTAHFYMFGGPGETRETVLEGIENILSIENAVHFVFLGVRILPGSTLYRQAVKDGLVRDGDRLVDSVYYFDPGLDRQWTERTLNDAFSDKRSVIYPPNAADDKLKILHQLGYSGPMWELLLAAKGKRERKKHHGAAASGE